MTETKEIVYQLRRFISLIESDSDVPNPIFAEAADRLEKQQKKIRNQRREIEKLRNGLGEQ